MKVVCAPNALKGTLTATEASAAIAEGVRSAVASAAIIALPIADGGDGTRAVLVHALRGKEVSADVSDPLGRPVSAAYGVIDAGETVVVDVASASGLALLEPSERDPLRTTSFGTGELLRSALQRGSRRVILGVGGSATVDGGVGLLSALGVRFLDAHGRETPLGGAGLLELAAIDASGLLPSLRRTELVVVCDVENPLLGPAGAAAAFAPQKGADASTVEKLEAGLARLAAVLEELCGRNVGDRRFGGAAGGIAASLEALLNARLVPGIDFVLDRVGFDAHLAGADLVITAEGRLDASSLRNKGPVGVARRARSVDVPTLALVGSVDPALDLRELPFAEVFTMRPREDFAAMQREARSELVRTAEKAAFVWSKRV